MSKVLVTETNLQNIANAIRSKNGSSGTYKPAQMATAISALPSEAESVAKHFAQKITVYTADYFSGCKSIQSYAFMNNTKIAEVAFPNTVTIISSNAFSGCSNLSTVSFPASVTTLGPQSFYRSPNLGKATYTFLKTTPPTIQSNTFNVNAIEKIIVPNGCGNAYKTATNWSLFADYIEEAEA